MFIFYLCFVLTTQLCGQNNNGANRTTQVRSYKFYKNKPNNFKFGVKLFNNNFIQNKQFDKMILNELITLNSKINSFKHQIRKVADFF